VFEAEKINDDDYERAGEYEGKKGCWYYFILITNLIGHDIMFTVFFGI